MPLPPLVILWPIDGSTIYHHLPPTPSDKAAPPGNGYWWFARSSLGGGYDYSTNWKLTRVSDGLVQTFTMPGISGSYPGVGSDDLWKLDATVIWSTTEYAPQISFTYQPWPPDPIPTASFTNYPKEFFESKTVQFNDTSSGNPTSWSWKYRISDSDDPWVEFSTLKDPTKVFSV